MPGKTLNQAKPPHTATAGEDAEDGPQHRLQTASFRVYSERGENALLRRHSATDPNCVSTHIGGRSGKRLLARELVGWGQMQGNADDGSIHAKTGRDDRELGERIRGPNREWSIPVTEHGR
eukprot:1707846-Pyramimonas_sp.AAC.1